MSKTFKVGVVVGKFNPPHLGHKLLIDTAAARCEHVTIIVCDRADQTIAACDRASWIADTAPANCSVLITPDDIPDESVPWAQRTLELLPQAPDAAFTSEAYGENWARAMGCVHESVDQTRLVVPVCATRIRRELRTHFDVMVPAARAALARRVVLVGAESCGKSTLAAALAEHYQSVWVPEYGRIYWEGRRYLTDQQWSDDEFLSIAQAQQRLEDDLARQCRNGVVIADTDALVTKVWQQRYCGSESPAVAALANNRIPHMYIVCAADFEWVQDGSRESREHRQWMFEAMRDAAQSTGTPTFVVTGSREERLAAAVAHIEPVLQFGSLT